MTHWYRLVLIPVSGLALSCGLISPPDDEDACTPLAATQPADLVTGPFLVNEAMTFCNTVHAFQYQVYAMRSTPVLVDEFDGFDAEWTFPDDVRVRKADSGVAVQWGTTSGRACARHWNACTEPGAFACQDVTVVSENVWAPIRYEDNDFNDGAAAAEVGGFVYVLNPRYRHGVWKGDPKTNTWTRVSSTFPEGVAASGTYTGGVAIGHGTDIWFLTLDKKFRFDTTTNTWSAGEKIPLAVPWYSRGLVHDGKLYVVQPGSPVVSGRESRFFRFDPSTQALDELGGGLGVDDALAFVRNGKLVFGAGNRCDARLPNCWVRDFYAYEPSTGEWSLEPYKAPATKHTTVALDFDGFTLFATADEKAYRLDDNATTLVEVTRNPALGCAPPTPVDGHFRAATITLGGRGFVIGGEGGGFNLTNYLP